MTITNESAPLDMVIEWEGLGTVTVRDVIQHYHGGAYKPAFLRRAIAEGNCRSVMDLARWENHCKRRIRESGMRGRRHPNSEIHIVPKRPMPWPRD